MSIVVGVDGGGTRASAVAIDETGRELVRLQGAAGILEGGRTGEMVKRLATIVRSVLEKAEAAIPCDAVLFALAGAGREPQRTQVEAALRSERLGRHLEVVTDAEAAFHDAFADAPGILLISGTGSIAWGRGPEGTRRRVGGWGARMGDEGSGFAIALAGLRAVARAADGRDQPTGLTDALLLEPGLNDPESLVRWAESARKKDIASLAPTVIRLGDSDPAAREILADAVGELVLHVAAIADQLGPWEHGPRVALAGGLIAPGRPLHDRVRSGLEERIPGIEVSEKTIDGARGAADLALRRLD